MKNNLFGRLLAVIVTLSMLQQQVMAKDWVYDVDQLEGCQVTTTVKNSGDCQVTTMVKQAGSCQVTTTVENLGACQVATTVDWSDTAVSEKQNAILNACRLTTDVFWNREGSHYSVGSDLVFGDIAKSYADCTALCGATYVAMVLYSSGVLSEEYINAYNYQWVGDGGIPTMLADAGWVQLPTSQALPGDVIIDYGVNAMIYAGSGKVWDLNTCIGSRVKKPYLANIEGCQVWRVA